MKNESLYMATASSNSFLGYYNPIDIPLNDETDYIITITPMVMQIIDGCLDTLTIIKLMIQYLT